MLHAWHADLRTAPDPDPAALAPAEHQRLAHLRTPVLRQTYARAHAFMRAVLGRYTGQPASELAIVADAHGKPTLAHSALHVNLSYRPGRVLLALSDAGPVGADLEPLLPLADAGALVQQLFSPSEQAALRAATPAGWWPLFYFIWTRKEAYAKALGMGLRMEFAAFSVLDGEALPGGWVLHSCALTGNEQLAVSNEQIIQCSLCTANCTLLVGDEVFVAAIATPTALPLHHFHYPADL